MTLQFSDTFRERWKTRWGVLQGYMAIFRASAFAVTLSLTAHEAAADGEFSWNGTTIAGNPCFGIEPGFGPFDYTDPDTRLPGKYGRQSPLYLVESAHFTPPVEQLITGRSGGKDPIGDINYTLRAFPNHHRALWSVSRHYLRKLKSTDSDQLMAKERLGQGTPPPECYFHRAKAFAPNDKMVSAVFGIYLHKRGMLDAALKEYQEAEAKLPKYPELVYNMGLLYFDLGQVDKAQEYAERARVLGYPLDGLSTKIQRKRAEADSSAKTGN